MVCTSLSLVATLLERASVHLQLDLKLEYTFSASRGAATDWTALTLAMFMSNMLPTC